MLERFRFIFKVHFIIIILAILCGIYWMNVHEKAILSQFATQSNTNRQRSDSKYTANDKDQDHEKEDELFTSDTLARYNGENKLPIYLALLGRVYDVTRGAKHYGPGCAYNYFVGRDASVSFVTGDFDSFEPEKADDVLTLRSSDMLSLINWEKFYESDYIYKGKLIGRFYLKNGQPTEYCNKFRAMAAQAVMDKIHSENIRNRYPDCNIEWSVETGSHVWCTTSSGGKQRDWIGYPRKIFEIGNDNFRCACVNKDDLDTNEIMIKSYENCDQFSHECYYHVTDN